jgi:hypothetical protein
MLMRRQLASQFAAKRTRTALLPLQQSSLRQVENSFEPPFLLGEFGALAVR